MQGDEGFLQEQPLGSAETSRFPDQIRVKYFQFLRNECRTGGNATPPEFPAEESGQVPDQRAEMLLPVSKFMQGFENFHVISNDPSCSAKPGNHFEERQTMGGDGSDLQQL